MGTTKIKARCPSCGRAIRALEPMQVATTVVTRTCPNPECREVWQITVRPLRVRRDGRIDRLDWTFLRHG
jgi:hypothetical protein